MQITVPTDLGSNPLRITINGVSYSLCAGERIDVPEEIANELYRMMASRSHAAPPVALPFDDAPLTAAQLAALNSGATAQNIAAIAGKAEATSVAAQAVVGSGGVISFKNAGGTELFTVALPIYSGGVT